MEAHPKSGAKKHLHSDLQVLMQLLSNCYIAQNGLRLDYWLHDWGFRVQFPEEARNSLCSTSSRRILGPTKIPIQPVQGVLNPEVRRPARETDHSPLSSAYVKNGGFRPPLPDMSSRRDVYWIRYRNKFTLTCSSMVGLHWEIIKNVCQELLTN